MNNFGTLLLYELKKIIQNKFTITAMMAILFLLMADAGSFSYGKADQEIKDAEMEIDGRVLNDDLLSDMVDGSDEYGVEFHTRKNMIYMGLIDFIHKNMEWGQPLSVYTSADIYKTRLDNNAVRMHEYRLSEGETAYWIQNEAQVEKPFTWRYTTGPNSLLTGFATQGAVCLFLAALALSAMFSGEGRQGTEHMIFVTKNGKHTIYYAKLTAGCLYLSSAALFFTIIYASITYMKLGIEGLDAQIQVFLPQISENMKMWQAVIHLFVILIFASVLFAVAAMVLSELLHNSLAVMGGMLGIFFLSIVLVDKIPERLRLLSQMISLIPTNMVSISGLCEYRLIGIYGYYLTEYQFAPVLYAVLSLIAFQIGKAAYLRQRK